MITTLNNLNVGDECDVHLSDKGVNRIKITRKTKYLMEYHHLSNPNITYSTDMHTASSVLATPLEKHYE